MSHSNRQRFLQADSPHNSSPSPDNITPQLIICAMVVFLVLISLALIYIIFRTLTRTLTSKLPDQPQQHSSRGLLRSLPVIAYDEQNKAEAVCAICLKEYEKGDRLRTMPCDHVFHRTCVDKWLIEFGLCPMCRRVAVNMEEVRAENARRCSERLMATYALGSRQSALP